MKVLRQGNDVMPSACAFCGRNADADGVSAIIGSKLSSASDGTPVGICVDCSKNMLYTFYRAAELTAEAQRISDKLSEDGNNNGICVCPGCVLTQLLKEDKIMKALEAEHSSYCAEEIIATTRH